MSAGVMGLQIALGLGMVGLAVAVLFMRDLMASAVALAGFSLLLALEFYVLQAPDVAIAEAGIGAGLTTAIFMVAIRAVTAKGKKKVEAPAPAPAAEPEPLQPVDAPVAEVRQDAADQGETAAAPEIPEVPEVPETPENTETPEPPVPGQPTPVPPEKEAP